MPTPWAADPSLQPLKRRQFDMTLSQAELDDMLATLTPTQELLMDVLAARTRLGDSLWTFSKRHERALNELDDRRLLQTMHGITPNTVRARFTVVGKAIWLDQHFDAGALHPEYGIALIESVDGQQAHRTAMWIRDYAGNKFTAESVVEQAKSYNAIPDQTTTSVPMERKATEWRPLGSST